MAIPHNSKCRYGERGAAAARPKAVSYTHLVLLSHTTLLSGEAAKAAAEALQSGKLDRKEMEESVDRILAAKAKLCLLYTSRCV